MTMQTIAVKKEDNIMLKTTKSINLNGTSETGGGIAVTMNANIYDNGTININNSVSDIAAYEANKEEARADIEAFNKTAYSIQDSMKEVTHDESGIM